MRHVCGVILIVFLFLLSENSHALITFEDAVFPELATNGRALASGNAFIGRVDDASAVFYNPAGLGTIRNVHLHLSNFHMEVNKGWIDIGTEGRASDVMSKFPKSFSLDGTRELLITQPDKLSHSRFNFMPNFTMRYFSAGYLFSKQNRAAVGGTASDIFEYATRTDHGPFVAGNISLFGGILKFGLSTVLLMRSEAIGEQDLNTTIDLQDSDYNSGTALIGTAGTKLTLPWKALPTFSAVLHNSFNAKFSESSGSAGAPAKIRQTIDLGFSLTPKIGKTTRVSMEVNWKDFTDKYPDVTRSRKLTGGIEFDLARFMFIRFGYGDGFGSFGLGLKTQKLEFDLSTYAVDTTTSKFRGEEDRRFSMTISYGF